MAAPETNRDTTLLPSAAGPLLAALALGWIVLGLPATPALGRPRTHRTLGGQTLKRSVGRDKQKRAAQAHAAVIGGSSAPAGTFPELAYIRDSIEEEDLACTGTVVASDLVLTAGHCAENLETGFVDEPSGYTVITGNVNRGALSAQVSAVSQVIVYPGFVPGLLARDAALLVLATPTTAPAVPLWTAANAGPLQPGRAAAIVGWGREYYEQEFPPLTLKWATTAIQSQEWCANNALGFYAPGELCAINPPSYSTGACQGDSGGPLLVSTSEGPVEVGITSHGAGECSTLQPTIFTRTDILVSWVREWAEAEKPPAAVPTPVAPSTPAQQPVPAPPAPRPVPPAPLPSSEGVYRGSTSQPSTPISVVVGAGGRRITAIATKVLYHCPTGRSISEPLEGLSNGDPQPLTEAHSFAVTFVGSERESITGTVDPATGHMSGALSARWRTHRYGLCTTGHISWSAQRSQTPPPTAALAGTGSYHGWTNQAGHILLTIAAEGRQLTRVQFSADYHCPRHHNLHLTEEFLSPSERWPLESLGTFTLSLGGHNYTGRVDGAFNLSNSASAFGTLEATITTRYGRCHTETVSWQT